MSRGHLKLISLYRSGTHSINEHCIRMGVPGMPLFDKDENEIPGAAHPIAP